MFSTFFTKKVNHFVSNNLSYKNIGQHKQLSFLPGLYFQRCYSQNNQSFPIQDEINQEKCNFSHYITKWAAFNLNSAAV